MDLDLGVLVTSLFFLSYSFIAFVVVVGFGSEGLDHFMCSCHCISCIGLSSPRLYVEVKFEKLFTLGCLSTLELVPPGCFGAQTGGGASELNHCGVKLRASVGVSN